MGLSPYAMKKFVCILGYAYVAMEMLFGTAGNPGSKVPLRTVGRRPP